MTRTVSGSKGSSPEVSILRLEGKALDKALEEYAKMHPKFVTWSEKEDYILKKLYGKVSNPKIAIILGRYSRQSVAERAKRLGLSSDTRG